MAWYNFWKPSAINKVSEPSLVSAKSDLSIWDYSPKKYNAYWEVVESESPYGFASEVRFMSRSGPVLEIHSVEGPTKENVAGLVAKLVKEKMTQYKVE